ncbi:MAG: MarR family transcriptional regulator, partial [Paenibacillus sp.]
DKADRRAVRVKLTEEGYKTTEEGQKQFEEQINGLIKHLGEEESLHLADLLKKVYEYYEMRSQEREK